MKKTGKIYKLTNTITEKSYVGLTKSTLEKRLTLHKRSVKHGSNTMLHNSIRKYGMDNFTMTLLEEGIELEDLCQREVYYIEYYKTFHKDGGLNLTRGGEFGNTITNHPNIDEIRKKMSLSHLGEKNFMYGKNHTEETRKKMRDNHKDFSKCNHPQAKKYVFISPEGVEYQVCGEFKIFCDNMGLSWRTVHKYIDQGVINLTHKRSIKHNGWEVKTLTKN